MDLVLVSVDARRREETKCRFYSKHSEDNIVIVLPLRYVPDSHSLLDVGRGDLIAQIHHELGKLLHVNDVLRILRVSVDYLSAPKQAEKVQLHDVC